ncbi:MAG: DUF262 domain-containing protein [Bacteroidaceae bacterium]|nr:DUF262 domain-containing protein [Bacteroidaceae bacterium]
MNNIIERKAISDLLTGGYFYIPSYQRGYRWTPMQVTQLLRDLFSYANEPHGANTTNIDGDYYCLQPIVARPVTNKDVLKQALQEDIPVSEDNPVWEIIDGQQRLTTIYILYKYLMTKEGISDEELEEDYGGKKLYHLIYATRKGSSQFLEELGKSDDNDTVCNIDYFHMRQAYNTIDQWIRGKGDYADTGGIALCKRYQLDETVKNVRIILFNLLNAGKGKKNSTGSVQILWYELSKETDAISEFRKINTGKIYLTDAELIKALFLKKQSDVLEHIQMQRALEWEGIENTLHNDSFWYFLNKRGYNMPNRIDFVFQLAYKAEHLKDVAESQIEDRLKECEAELKNKNRIFNFYYDKFDGLSGEALRTKIEEEWEAVSRIFHVLEDWYEDVICYNLIGMLCQYNDNLLPKGYIHFLKMEENQSRDDFKEWMKNEIRLQVSGISVKDDKIDISYGDPRVFNLLLLLNVNHLNRQAEHSKDGQNQIGSIYKFPFAVLTSQKWDIEHIDSFTENGLKRVDDQKTWIETAMKDLEKSLNENENTKKEIEDMIENDKLIEAIDKLRKIAGENDTVEEKNNIGNLALLDAGTNRSYGNSLFITKRKKIIDCMKNGVFVPVSTSYVFMKLFDEEGTGRTQWTEEDMKEYQRYICKELSDYLNIEED